MNFQLIDLAYYPNLNFANSSLRKIHTLIRISLWRFVSMPSLMVRKCEPDKSSGNKSDMICSESFLGRVCGTEVSKILSKHIKYCGKLVSKLEKRISAGGSSTTGSSGVCRASTSISLVDMGYLQNFSSSLICSSLSDENKCCLRMRTLSCMGYGRPTSVSKSLGRSPYPRNFLRSWSRNASSSHCLTFGRHGNVFICVQILSLRVTESLAASMRRLDALVASIMLELFAFSPLLLD